MHVAVLVKQVPDVREGSVGLRSDGTINRSSARAITNPCDLHAIEAALQLGGEVTAISMGPASAESSLQEALAMGASRGILLTDRLVAGSDTWATANALSAVVRRAGPFDLILSGTTALDGETGHVGPQVAQRLDLPQITGCEAAEISDGKLVARRIVEGGYEVVTSPLPALLTVAAVGFEPRYPTYPDRVRAHGAAIECVAAADVGLTSDQVGLRSSPTRVAKMELVPLPVAECLFIGRNIGWPRLLDELEQRGALQPGVEHVRSEPHVRTAPELQESQGTPSIWVVGETRGGELAAVTCELLSKATELAATTGAGVAAFMADGSPDRAVEEAAHYGAACVFRADHAELSPYRCLPHSRVLARAIASHSPDVVLFGATSIGRELAPRVAAMLDTGLAADCTGLYLADWEHRGEVRPHLLHQVRPAMSASVLATCICPDARPQMASIRPGVFAARPTPRPPRIEPVPVSLKPSDLVVEVLERHIERTDVSLAGAEVVVAGGAGCTKENWHLVEGLAQALGGRVAASRGAVEAGLAPRALQVGQTGSTIKPRLYIACGISGALQHVVGMKSAETVIAINRDPEAAIFRYADYGIVADIREGIPQLRTALAGNPAR